MPEDYWVDFVGAPRFRLLLAGFCRENGISHTGCSFIKRELTTFVLDNYCDPNYHLWCEVGYDIGLWTWPETQQAYLWKELYGEKYNMECRVRNINLSACEILLDVAVNTFLEPSCWEFETRTVPVWVHLSDSNLIPSPHWNQRDMYWDQWCHYKGYDLGTPDPYD